MDIGCYNARLSGNNNNTPYDCRLTLLCLRSQSVMWRLPGGFLPFFSFSVLLPRCLYLALGCNLWLPPDALLCGNILSFDCVGSSSFLDDCRPFSGRIPGNSLVHTGLCYNLPFVVRRARGRSRHVAVRYIYLRARVGSGCLFGVALLPSLDCGAVLCAALVLLAG